MAAFLFILAGFLEYRCSGASGQISHGQKMTRIFHLRRIHLKMTLQDVESFLYFFIAHIERRQ